MSEQTTKPTKVKIKVPLNQINMDDMDVVVCINGNVTQIKRGVEVEVDPQIKKILEDAKYI